MIGETRLLTELSRLAAGAAADGVSVCAHARTRRVFRFAYEAIHQNLRQEGITVSIKLIRDGRVGVASTESLNARQLKRCVDAAATIAAHAPRQPDLPPLPRAHRLSSRGDYLPATAQLTAVRCIGAIQRMFRLCRGAGARLAGSMMSGEDEFAVVNSSGVSCYAASTVTGAKLVTMYRSLSGYASAVHRRFPGLNLDRLLQHALQQCLHRREAIAVPLGDYEVILEPQAVADLLEWLGSIAFGAKSVQAGTSFLAGRMGDQVMHPSVTLYDDGRDPRTLRMPFDFEGVPKQKVVLVERGRAAGMVFDSLFGQRFGHASTGHAMPPDETEGPYPLHLAMAPGRTSVEQMVRACRRGLLIPRFHYVNGLLNPREALMTGLLREGAFLIEDGQRVAPVATMRFTQSLLEAFRDVRGISKDRQVVADPAQGLGCAVMPTVHLASFKFTGRSQ